MTRRIMLAAAALALVLLVTTACLVVRVETLDLGQLTCCISDRGRPVIQHGPYFHVLRPRLPTGDVNLAHWQTRP